MTLSTMTVAVDTFGREDTPSTNFGETPFVTLNGTVGVNEKRGFIYAAAPFPVGATVASALLRLYARGAWTAAPHNLTVRRITQKWKESGAGGLTWNNQPTVDGAASVVFNIPADLADGALIEIDVTTLMQTAAAGGAFHGFRIELDTTPQRRVHSAESATSGLRPRLIVDWSIAPAEPVDLKPSGGLSVSLSTPVLQWRFVDTEGESQAEFQVQVDDTANLGSPTEDSGWVASTLSQYQTTIAIADAATRYWRVRTKDAYGLISPWSDIVSFRRDIKGVLVVTNPPPGASLYNGFETDSDSNGLADDWLAYESVAGDADAVYSLSSVNKHGNKSQKAVITANTGFKGISRTVALTTGSLFSIGVWVYSDIQATYQILCDDTGNPTASKVVPAAEWTFMRLRFAAATTGNKTVFLRTAQANVTARWDGFLIGPAVEETTPPITHTFTGRVQKSIEYILQENDPDDGNDAWETLYRSGRTTTASLEFTLPKGLLTSQATLYRIAVRVWDTIDRIATSGDQRYVQVIREFVYSRSGTPTAPTALVADVPLGSDPDYPAMVLTWQRATQPDFFAITIDGKIIEDRIDSDDVLNGAPNYRYVFWKYKPRRSQTVEVEAVTLDGGKYKHSDPVTVVAAPEPAGIWLVAPDYGIRVVLTGKDEQNKSLAQNGETFTPPGRRAPIRVRDNLRGYEGQLTGSLFGAFSDTAIQWLDRLERLSALPLTATIRAIFGANNIPVVLGSVEIGDAFHERYTVAVEYWQVAEFPMRLRR